MRLKALIALAITTTLLMAALAVSIHTCRKLSADRNRLLQNQTQLLQATTAPDTTRTTDGRNVLITPTITLKPAEFLASGDPLLQRARAMHIRPSRITQAATAAAETHTNITASITTDSFTYTDAYTTNRHHSYRQQHPIYPFTPTTTYIHPPATHPAPTHHPRHPRHHRQPHTTPLPLPPLRMPSRKTHHLPSQPQDTSHLRPILQRRLYTILPYFLQSRLFYLIFC